MKLSTDALGGKLAAELGAGLVQSQPPAMTSYAVDGKAPILICFPSTSEQVSSVLRICAEVQAAVAPWGGGTSMRLGNIPRAIDVAIAMEKLDEFIEHDDANLTATAQAGTRLASFQEVLGRARQFFPVDPPYPGRATLGGIIAANTNGPRRILHGGLRDLVIGMKMVLAGGEQVKTGGKVVKNVAGYDLCKLFIGSLGTLGIITELTVRATPLPESFVSFLASGPLDRCAGFVGRLFSSSLLPAAVTIVSSEAAKRIGCDSEMPVVAIRAEGFEESVARHLSELENLARAGDLEFEALRDQPHRQLWERIGNFPANQTAIVYRITVPTASTVEILRAVEQWNPQNPARYVADAGTGTIWISLDPNAAGMERLIKLSALARERNGHAVIVAAPTELKEGIDVWGEAPPSMNLMREIKRQFDPQGILNPGRFIGRL